MPQICRNGRCVNTLDSYHCECDEGFVYVPALHACQDVDECADERPPCIGDNVICQNTRGSFSCSCVAGYKLASSQRHCVGSFSRDTCHFFD